MESIQCPFCPQQLFLPSEQIHQSVQCPACGRTFTAAPGVDERMTSAAPGAAPFGGPTPYAPQFAGVTPTAGSADDWDKVRLGVSLVYYGIVLVLLALLTAFVGGFVAALSGAEPIIWLVAGLVVVAAFAQVVLQIVGKVLCLRAPPDHGAHGLAVASLILAAGGFALTCSGAITTIAADGAVGAVGAFGGRNALQRTNTFGSWMSNLGQAADVIGTVVFVFFLRAAARCIGDEQLAASARQLLLLGGLALVVLLLMFFILLAGAGSPGDNIMVLIGSCAAAVVGLAAFLKYVGLLSRCRDELALHVRRTLRAARATSHDS